jgi:transcriptional regulator NrdR family protein
VIAEAIMQRLRKVDGIAWLRYASFYEDFRELSRFAVEIVNLGGGGKGGKGGN